MPVLLSIISAALFGAADYLCGLSARSLSTFKVLALSQVVGGALALGLAPVVGPAVPEFADLAWGGLAGISGLAGLAFLYSGLARGRVAIVSPLSALISAILPAIYGVLSGERPRASALAGAALCIPAILLLAWEPGDKTASAPAKAGGRSSAGISLALGAGAGLFLGAFYIFIAKCADGSGLWPLAGARTVSIIILFAIAAARRISRQPSKPGLNTIRAITGIDNGKAALIVGAAIAGGLLDISANIAFLYASRTGLLIIVAVITSLYPAPTVILARIFLAEKLPPRRIAGLVIALAGIALAGMK